MIRQLSRLPEKSGRALPEQGAHVCNYIYIACASFLINAGIKPKKYGQSCEL